MSATAARTASRWDHYLLRRGGECASFWKDYLADSNRQLLLILGLGFDPRMCLGLRMLLEARPSCVKQCLLIEYDEGANSPSHQYGALVKSNRDGLSSLLGHPGAIQTARVPMWSDDRRRRTGSRRASDVIQPNILERFTDIVVDVSAMPRGIYFPLIAKILFLLDASTGAAPSTNLHVIVPENITMDRSIQEEGIDDDASYMHGFASDLVQESTAAVPRVWIPVLGEGKEEQIIRLYD